VRFDPRSERRVENKSAGCIRKTRDDLGIHGFLSRSRKGEQAVAVDERKSVEEHLGIRRATCRSQITPPRARHVPGLHERVDSAAEGIGIDECRGHVSA